jgi:hypothetical protein
MAFGASKVQEPSGAVGGGSPKVNGSRGDLRKLLLDERRAAMKVEGVQRPVPLDGAKLSRALCYRRHLYPLRLKPDVLCPSGGTRWTGSEDQPAMHCRDLA